MLQKGLLFRLKAKNVHNAGALCLLNPPNPKGGNSFHRFQGFRACRGLAFSAADRRYTSQQPSFFFQGAMKQRIINTEDKCTRMLIPGPHDDGIYSLSTGGLRAPTVWAKERQYYVDRRSVAGVHSYNVFGFAVALF